MVAQPPWLEITLSTGVEIDNDLRVPMTAVRRYLPLIKRLAAQAPADPTPTEAAALEAMVRGRTVVEALVGQLRRQVAPDTGTPRAEVVEHLATATGLLAVAARSKVPEVAAEAGALLKELFGDEGPLAHATPDVVCDEVAALHARLETDPALRARLLRFVPATVLDAASAANAVLAAALGMDEPHPQRVPVGRNAARDFLRRRIGRHVRCVAASADEDDAASVIRANAALAPLKAALRSSKKRGSAEGRG